MAITIDGTNGLTTDNAALKLDGTTLVVDDTNNRVGIGTSSPTVKLEVNGGTDNEPIKVVSTDAGSYIAFADDGTTGSTRLGAVSDDFKIDVNSSERLRITSAGLLQFNSGYGSVATAYGCRAWVNFNGRDTVAIRASGNVSSITDNGTGDYTVNFTTAMPDANYCFTSMVFNTTDAGTRNLLKSGTTPTDSALRFTSLNSSGTAQDADYTCVAVFR